jgi:hypothetical protein
VLALGGLLTAIAARADDTATPSSDSGKTAAQGAAPKIRVALMDIELQRQKDLAVARLNRIGADYERVPPDASLDDLKKFQVVFFPQGWGSLAGLGDLATTYQAYIEQGGGILFSAPEAHGRAAQSPALNLLPYPASVSGGYAAIGRSVRQYTSGKPHPLMQGVVARDLPIPGNHVTQCDPAWTVLARAEYKEAYPTLLVAEKGKGRAVLHMNWDYSSSGHLHYFSDRFVVRLIKWLAQRPDADVQAGDETLGPRRLSAWVQALAQDAEELLAREPAATQEALRKAEQLLRRDAQAAATWTAYSEAIKLVRQNRSKAAIPLLLGVLADDRLQSDNYRDAIYKTFVILTGRPIPQRTVEEVAREWWSAHKGEITVDPAQMTPGECREIVVEILRQTAWGMEERVPESKDTADRRLLSVYQIERFFEKHSPYQSYDPSDLHPSFLPELLAAADKPRTRWCVIGPLAVMRQKGWAKELDQVVADREAPSARRVLGAIAILNAEQPLPVEPLIQILRTEKDVELRMAAIYALGHSKDAAAAETVAGFLQDADSQVRQIAEHAKELPH